MRHAFERNPELLITWRALGAGLFVGLVTAFSAYALTGKGVWFLAPFVGCAVAWRLRSGHWWPQRDR